jgi:hypothetical protein
VTVAIVSVETVLLVLLLVLVAGLLRSHAEILRRLETAGSAGDDASGLTPSPPQREPGAEAVALAGPTPEGDAVHL